MEQINRANPGHTVMRLMERKGTKSAGRGMLGNIRERGEVVPSSGKKENHEHDEIHN